MLNFYLKIIHDHIVKATQTNHTTLHQIKSIIPVNNRCRIIRVEYTNHYFFLLNSDSLGFMMTTYPFRYPAIQSQHIYGTSKYAASGLCSWNKIIVINTLIHNRIKSINASVISLFQKNKGDQITFKNTCKK
jgi:hypothetical protein